MSYGKNQPIYSIPINKLVSPTQNLQQGSNIYPPHQQQQHNQQQHLQQQHHQQQLQQQHHQQQQQLQQKHQQQPIQQLQQHRQGIPSQQPYPHQHMHQRPKPPQPPQHQHDHISERPAAELPSFKPHSFSHQQRPVMRLRPLSDCNDQCSLLQRRISRKSQFNSTNLHADSHTSIHSNNQSSRMGEKSSFKDEIRLTGVLFNELKARNEVCSHCNEHFLEDEKMVNLHGQVWHEKCFVCAQCFQPFPEGIFFEFGDRRYCEKDFQTLLAPRCYQCKEFIMGRVIKAVGTSWHPECFKCQLCHQELADVGFIRHNKRSLCKECHEKEKVRLLGKNVCFKCRSEVNENDYLKYNGQVYHSYHFNCHSCGVELNSIAREKDKELYCLRCYDKQGVPICAACRRPVEEKVIHALGKMWHVEHFVCVKCEKPFFGNRHYEDKGLAYCELHYYQMRGGTCFHCNSIITGNELKALNKSFCQDHFCCFACNKKMDNKSKFIELDGKPTCKNCFKKFPSEMVKRLKKLAV